MYTLGIKELFEDIECCHYEIKAGIGWARAWMRDCVSSSFVDLPKELVENPFLFLCLSFLRFLRNSKTEKLAHEIIPFSPLTS